MFLACGFLTTRNRQCPMNLIGPHIADVTITGLKAK
jgi:hypothetical protein